MITDDMIHGSWKAPRSARQRLGLRQSSAALGTSRANSKAPEDWRTPKPRGTSEEAPRIDADIEATPQLPGVTDSFHSSRVSLRLAPRIEADTHLVPRAVAEAVWEEASTWLDAEMPRAWIDLLTELSNVIYAHNRRYRQKIRGQGNSGRDWLWSFTRHWMSALISQHRPHLYRCLPASYGVGRDLPAKTTKRSDMKWPTLDNHRITVKGILDEQIARELA